MLNAAPDLEAREVENVPSPRELIARLPLSPRAAAGVARARSAIRDVIHGKDRERLVVIVGPCSVHDPEAALEYADRLQRIADRTAAELVMVMRTYFEKPRTTVGWKGLISDPQLDESFDLARGLALARELLSELGERGLPCASELLDITTARYLQDGLAWAAIGARTVQSQPHREMASGLPMPVGFKNGTDGQLGVAIDALDCASRPQTFLGSDGDGVPAVVRTAGNPDGHVVLRGGGGIPNHDAESVAWAAGRARRLGPTRPVWVDCSHGNSNKDHRRQGSVCREVLDQVKRGQSAIGGILIESYLHPGRQDWKPGAPLARGVSITDACIGWSETEDLLLEAAEAVAVRRRVQCGQTGPGAAA